MEKVIGKVNHFYNRIGVAVLELDEGLQIGDLIHFAGHKTDFTQHVRSLEIEHQKVQAAAAGADVALKVDERVREGDKIYRILDVK